MRRIESRRVVCCSGAAARDPALAQALTGIGLQPETVTTTAGAMAHLLAHTGGAAVLDAECEALDARALLRRRRELGNRSPVILLLDPGGRVDHRIAFEMGADDCVTRPVRVRELVARLERLMEGEPLRTAGSSEPVLTFGTVRVDVTRFEARRDDVPVVLPARAFQLLRLLARRRGQVVSRDAIMDELWGPHVDVNQRTIDNLVLALRQLIEPEPGRPRVLRTVHRVGYRLAEMQVCEAG